MDLKKFFYSNLYDSGLLYLCICVYNIYIYVCGVMHEFSHYRFYNRAYNSLINKLHYCI